MVGISCAFTAVILVGLALFLRPPESRFGAPGSLLFASVDSLSSLPGSLRLLGGLRALLFPGLLLGPRRPVLALVFGLEVVSRPPLSAGHLAVASPVPAAAPAPGKNVGASEAGEETIEDQRLLARLR